MKIMLAKRELLALAFHIQPKQIQSMDQLRFRRAVWTAFNVIDMAADVGELQRMQRVTVSGEWMDRKALVAGDLEPMVLDWLISATMPPYDGPDADFLFEVHEKLIQAKKA